LGILLLSLPIKTSSFEINVKFVSNADFVGTMIPNFYTLFTLQLKLADD
jgi:hypothetical protein